MNLKISKEISYYDIEAKNLDVIKPLWEKLNQYHQETSKYFKQKFYTFTFEDRVNRFITNDNDELIKISIAKDTSKDLTVGYCISKINKSNTGEIESLFVESDYRGKYIGDFFMKDALEWFKEKEVRSVSIGVAYGNDNAIHFYKKYGFNVSLLKLENSNISCC